MFRWEEILWRSHRVCFYVANAVTLSPIFIGVISSLSSLHAPGRFALGFLVGIVLSALFFLAHLHRSHLRRRRALRIAQVSLINAKSVERFVKIANLEAGGFDKVNWLNMELEEIWPSLNQAVSGLLKVILQSVLDPYKFNVIQKILVKSVTLGTVSPLLGGVKFTSGGEDEVILDVELDWRHGQDAKIVIELQTTGPVLTVQIRDFVIFGVLKLVFKPLTDQFPGFGALMISLREPPVVDFQTRFLGGDILTIPGIDNVVDSIILTALTDILVWPNRIIIPVLQGDYSYLRLTPVGQLEVELLEADSVAKADIWGESDPYAIIYIRRKQGCMRTSSVKWNTSHPIWNENFLLDVEDLGTQKLTIQVFDYDRLKFDDFIGSAELLLSKLKPNKQEDLWVDLFDDLKKAEPKFRGKIHVCMAFKPFTQSIDSED